MLHIQNIKPKETNNYIGVNYFIRNKSMQFGTNSTPEYIDNNEHKIDVALDGANIETSAPQNNIEDKNDDTQLLSEKTNAHQMAKSNKLTELPEKTNG